MKLIVEIATDNAAFGDTGEEKAQEITECLSRMMLRFTLQPGVQFPIRDSNGNYVGFWQVTE